MKFRCEREVLVDALNSGPYNRQGETVAKLYAHCLIRLGRTEEAATAVLKALGHDSLPEHIVLRGEISNEALLAEVSELLQQTGDERALREFWNEAMRVLRGLWGTPDNELEHWQPVLEVKSAFQPG